MGIVFRKLGVFLTGFTLFGTSFFSPRLITIFFVHSCDGVPSNIDEALSINPSANVFVRRDLTSVLETG